MTRKPILLLALAFLFALAISLWPQAGQAQPAARPVIQNGYDLLAAVNSLRASNGLPAYSANSILMQIAQAQADYLAATGGASGHTGPGGTSPRDRAAAAGYPLGSFFSENWQSGAGMSPSGAVSVWQGDYDHLNTMISANLTEAGGGVSNAGGTLYYVLDAGSPSNYIGAPTVTPGGPTVTPGTPIVSQFMVPVIINTPDATGMVYHEVAYGQSLWSIAIAYNTKIETIKQLNNLGDIEIYVGQKLLVMRGATPAPLTPTQPATPTTEAAAIVLPASVTPFIPPVTVTVTVTPTKTASPSVLSGGRFNITALVIILAALAFAALGTWAGTRKAV
jgi:uncharacterized protein YkwD/LysM repeat protein